MRCLSFVLTRLTLCSTGRNCGGVKIRGSLGTRIKRVKYYILPNHCRHFRPLVTLHFYRPRILSPTFLWHVKLCWRFASHFMVYRPVAQSFETQKRNNILIWSRLPQFRGKYLAIDIFWWIYVPRQPLLPYPKQPVIDQKSMSALGSSILVRKWLVSQSV